MSSTAGLREQWAAANSGLDTSPMEIVDLVHRLVGLLDRAVEPLYESTVLTPSEVALLVKLRHLPRPIMVKRLGELSSLSKAGVSKALGRLQGQGFLERVPSPADKRSLLVSITERGKAVIDDLFPRQLAIEAEALKGVNVRENVVAALSELVETIERNTSRYARVSRGDSGGPRLGVLGRDVGDTSALVKERDRLA